MKYVLGFVFCALLLGVGCGKMQSVDDPIPSPAVESADVVDERQDAPALFVPAPGFEDTADEMIVETNDSSEFPDSGAAASASSDIGSDGSAAANDDVQQSEIVSPSVKTFNLSARQWEFSPSVITVDAGDTVRLIITSADVDHGFFLPAFGVDEFLQAGKTVSVEFVADKVGTYSFRCNIFCGAGHSGMTGTLIVR